MSNLQGKVALVTGAGRENGIGAAIAQRLAQAGAHVVVTDLCAAPTALPHGGNGAWEELTAVANSLTTYGVQSLPIRADVTKLSDMETAVAQIRDTFGRLDILVNNAGVIIGPAPVLHMAEESWRKTLEVNATGVFLTCKAALPLMIGGKQGGRIINISSIAAVRPRIYMSAYAGSKAAVVALTQSLAQEVGEFGITVNAILPGDVDTSMKQWGMMLEAAVTRQTADDVNAALINRIPVGRIGVPNDVAHIVAFLASAEAAFITGQAYNLTGGRELS
ncbi:MAG: SDR family oxidoreductase [Ardenticatenaceae bacterium]|nr:SDR family oxidoreductase [Ardenticatenaceae bacterium]